MSVVLDIAKLILETGSAFVDPEIKISCVYWDELSRNLSSLDVVTLGDLMALTVKEEKLVQDTI
jgi:hypothetical protein